MAARSEELRVHRDLEQFLRASHALPPEVEILPKDFPPE
jgi:hypothetical protein